jgi:CubicO group peptidase (beta-lactamase class C family)
MSIDAKALTDLAAETAARLDVAGAQVAVWDGTTVTEAGTGMANLATDQAVTPRTVFQIGSTTKLYAAALTMLLAEEGLVELDEPLASYLPGFRLADPQATASVTLRHLHSMSSGIDNGPYSDHGRGDECLERYVNALAGIPQIFSPGTGYGYSNASTAVAGRVAEVLTGQCWEETLRDRLLVPAGLDSTRSLMEDLAYFPLAVGYKRDGTEWSTIRPWRLSRSISPAGSTLCATAGDLVRFGSMMLAGGTAPNGTRVLSPESVAAIQQPIVETPTRVLAQRWCLGPYMKTWDGCAVLGHSGTNTSGSSYLLWVPERNVAVATVVNVPPRGYPFADAIFSAIFPSVFGIDKPAAPVPDPSIEFDPSRYTGCYVAHGVEHVVTAENGSLRMCLRSAQEGLEERQEEHATLLPLAPHRFLPDNVGISGGRGWDIAFVGAEGGPATHLINGFFAARRA